MEMAARAHVKKKKAIPVKILLKIDLFVPPFVGMAKL